MGEELKPRDVHTDIQKTEKLIQQAIEITELKAEIKALKEVVAKMEICLADVKKTVSSIQILILEFRLEVSEKEGKKPSWMITMTLTLLTGLVSALAVYVLTMGGR